MALSVRPYNTLQSNPQFWSWYVAAGKLCESDYCFPSGHTTGATEIAIVLMLCHIRAKKGKVAWIFPLCAFLTGISRIYLMVHYPSDVVAGFIIGILSGVLGYVLSNAVCKFLGRRKIDRVFDLNRKFKHGIRPMTAILAIFIGWLICFGVSEIKTFGEGGEKVQRCAYNGEYACQNEAQVDSKKYPPIDGHCYCKIHWKELSKQFEETGTIEDVAKKDTGIQEGMPIPNSDLFTFFNDPVMTDFCENFETNMPVKMRYFKANEADVEITDQTVIRDVFNTLKGVKVADEDTSGTQVTDSELIFTFFMPDSTQITIAFDSPSQLSYQGKKYYVINNNKIYNLKIAPENPIESEPEDGANQEEYPEEEWEEEE
ncbi:MAG: phosphatase PAP2 family protein [Lachnospiraceae bacterium]|nr:phosphatase PAP2 family protein [Lachnospiraceae bacterium]